MKILKLIARKTLWQLKSTFRQTLRKIETYFLFIRGTFAGESVLNRFREDRHARGRPPTTGFRNVRNRIKPSGLKAINSRYVQSLAAYFPWKTAGNNFKFCRDRICYSQPYEPSNL